MSESPSSSFWNCGLCTFLNTSSANVCEMCDTAKSLPLSTRVTNVAEVKTSGDPVMVSKTDKTPVTKHTKQEAKYEAGLAQTISNNLDASQHMNDMTGDSIGSEKEQRTKKKEKRKKQKKDSKQKKAKDKGKKDNDMKKKNKKSKKENRTNRDMKGDNPHSDELQSCPHKMVTLTSEEKIGIQRLLNNQDIKGKQRLSEDDIYRVLNACNFQTKNPPGWTFIEGRNSKGYNHEVKRLEGNLADWLQFANVRPDVKVFNSFGWMKYRARAEDTWEDWSSKPGHGMYIRNSVFPGWTFHPGLDCPTACQRSVKSDDLPLLFGPQIEEGPVRQYPKKKPSLPKSSPYFLRQLIQFGNKVESIAAVTTTGVVKTKLLPKSNWCPIVVPAGKMKGYSKNFVHGMYVKDAACHAWFREQFAHQDSLVQEQRERRKQREQKRQEQKFGGTAKSASLVKTLTATNEQLQRENRKLKSKLNDMEDFHTCQVSALVDKLIQVQLVNDGKLIDSQSLEHFKWNRRLAELSYLAVERSETRLTTQGSGWHNAVGDIVWKPNTGMHAFEVYIEDDQGSFIGICPADLQESVFRNKRRLRNKNHMGYHGICLGTGTGNKWMNGESISYTSFLATQVARTVTPLRHIIRCIYDSDSGDISFQSLAIQKGVAFHQIHDNKDLACDISKGFRPCISIQSPSVVQLLGWGFALPHSVPSSSGETNSSPNHNISEIK